MEMTKCNGFLFSAVSAGIKKNEQKDLGLIYSRFSASAAALFTRNRVQAAPVLADKERLKSGQCRAVIVNSGNANCCTGSRGLQDAFEMTRYAAQGLNLPEELVCVASTGVIGQPMPLSKVEAAVPGLVASLSPEGLEDFAEAIMTTDRIPKIASGIGKAGGKPYTVLGVAKGAGMIRPDMATMLCFLCTDLKADAEVLHNALVAANEHSFNRITVDGDTSTNDTVLIMANGESGAVLRTEEEEQDFVNLLGTVMGNLARLMVKDGEGATKVVEIEVKGAPSDKDARAVADTIAHSSLVKTALFGEDANWGRIIAAAGRSGTAFDPDRVDIFFNEVMMVKNGMTCGDKAEAAATAVLKTPEFSILVDLKNGIGKASVLTCDLTLEYIKINASYRS